MNPNDVFIFSVMEERFVEPINNFISTSTQNIAEYVAAPLAVAILIYVIGIGIMFIRGTHEISAMEFVMMVFKAAIIYTLATKSGEYIAYVSSIFFEHIPKEIGSALNGQTTNSTSSIDSLLRNALAAGIEIWKQSPNSFAIFIYALVVLKIWILGLLCCSVIFIVTLYAKVALSLVIALGPIFIALGLFKSTRRFTEAWIGQAANFAILQVLVTALGALLLSIASEIDFATGDAIDVVLSALNFGAVVIISVYIFFQLPSIASALASGGASLAFGTSIHRESGMLAAFRSMRGTASAPSPSSANSASRSQHSNVNISPAAGNSPSQTTAPAPERPPAPVTRPSS